MDAINKIIYLAIILVVVNYITEDFIYNNLMGVDVSPYSGSVQCFVGAYMYSPTWQGIPMPSTDDVMFAIVVGLIILGIFSAANKVLTKKQKLFIFLIPWLAYRVIGYYLMSQVPGCLDNFAVVDEVLSPFGLIFAALAGVLIIKFLIKRK